MKQEKSILDKGKSTILYGIAILMMVWHHLFGFPERIAFESTSAIGSLLLTSSLYFAYFCKICVAVYAFLSGYGLDAKLKKENRLKEKVTMMVKQAVRFFVRYWIVFAVWIPLGIALGKEKFDLIEFTKNLFGLSCTYNEEWWYVEFYIKMLVIAPFVQWILSRLREKSEKNELMLVTFIVCAAFINARSETAWLTYPLSFIIGMICSENELLDRIDRRIRRKKWIEIAVAVVCVIASISLKFCISTDNSFDYLLAPLFIFGCAKLLDSPFIEKGIGHILHMYGKHSVYIWLTHTFFIYYYFQDIMLKLRSPVLIYLSVLIVTLMFGMIADQVYRLIMSRNKTN